MIFSFHPDAEAEFNKAIEYYEEIESGLGFDFAIEDGVRTAIVLFDISWLSLFFAELIFDFNLTVRT